MSFQVGECIPVPGGWYTPVPQGQLFQYSEAFCIFPGVSLHMTVLLYPFHIL